MRRVCVFPIFITSMHTRKEPRHRANSTAHSNGRARGGRRRSAPKGDVIATAGKVRGNALSRGPRLRHLFASFNSRLDSRFFLFTECVPRISIGPLFKAAGCFSVFVFSFDERDRSSCDGMRGTREKVSPSLERLVLSPSVVVERVENIFF